MQSRDAQLLLCKYAPAMVYVAVEDDNGIQSIGSAFHVGEGIFITARHVVERQKILDIRSTEPIRVPLQEAFPRYPQEVIDEITKIAGTPPTWPVFPEPLRISHSPVFHSDDRIDVAAFRADTVHPKMPVVPLGGHLDDWIPRSEWRLSDALILGYPPIPLTTRPALVAARAEINAVSWIGNPPVAAFVLSSMPRGGFSGGLALHEDDFALGVISQSLVSDGRPAELGFLAVLSIEVIYQCLSENHLLPDLQKVKWGDFWNTETTRFIASGGLEVAFVNVHDDGKRFYFDVSAKEKTLMDGGLTASLLALSAHPYEREIVREDWVRIHVRGSPAEASRLVRGGGDAAKAAIEQTGLTKFRLGRGTQE